MQQVATIHSGSKENWTPLVIPSLGAAVGLLAAELLSYFYRPGWWMPACAGLLLALAAGGWLKFRGVWWGPITFWPAMFAFQGVWSTITIASGWMWWHGVCWAVFVLAWIVLCGLRLWILSKSHRSVALLSLERSREQELRELLDHYLSLSVKRETACAVREFDPDGNGYTAVVEFPPAARVTIGRLTGILELLRGGMKLPEGCMPEVSNKGLRGGSYRFRVPLTGRVVAPSEHPTICRPRSFRDPLTFGHMPDGSPWERSLFQTNLSICGARGAGKSVLLHQAIKGLAECTDVLVWMIDLNKGRTMAPWVELYAKGLLDRPIIDWVARDEHEACRMMDDAQAIVDARAAKYSLRKSRDDVDVLPIGPDLPAILIISDEGHLIIGSDAKGNARLAGRRLQELLKVSRGECVGSIHTTQRATSTYWTADLRSLYGHKVAGRLEYESDFGIAVDWGKVKPGIRATDIPTGDWYGPQLFRTFQWLPRAIHAVARTVSQWRPLLDAASEASTTYYAGRWDRNQEWLQWLATDGDEGDPVAKTERYLPPAAVAAAAPAAQREGRSLDDLKALVKAERAEVTATPADEPKPESAPDDGGFDWSADGFAKLTVLDGPRNVSGALQVAAEPTNAGPVNLTDGQRFIWLYLQEHGPTKTGALVDAVQAADISARRSSVSGWLKEMERQGLVTQPSYGCWQLAQG